MINIFINGYFLGEEQKEDKEKDKEEICRLLEDMIDDENVSINQKYILLSKIMKIAIRNRGDEETNIVLERFIDKFKELNKLSGKEKYNEIFDFSPQYVYSHWLEREIDITNYFNMIECISYLNSDSVYEKIIELYQNNKKITQNISSTMLNKDIIKMIDNDLIDFLSRYGKSGEKFEEIYKDEKKTRLFIKLEDRLKRIKKYSEEDELKIAEFITKLGQEDMIEEGEVNEELDLIIAISLSDNLYRQFIDYKNEKRKLVDFTNNIKEKCEEKINSKILNRRQALDALGMRFFGISYEEMKEIKKKYASDIDVMLEKYKSKNNMTMEEQNEFKALIVLRNIKEIINIKDTQSIVETYKELDKLEEFSNIDFATINALEENLRRVFAKDYKENVYYPKAEDQKEDIDGIKIYAPKEFNMMVHVVAAYGDFEIIDKNNPEKSAKELWRAIDKKENHILCASFISNYNLCLKRKMENDSKEENETTNIIFGFNKFGNNSVLMGAPYDIGSTTDRIDSDLSSYPSCFKSAKNMINKTRWLHNEVCIERRLEDKKEENIEPDYIICIDEINEESKKIAKDFGIPIILLDTREIAKSESEKIDHLFNEFYKTKSPEIIEEIVNRYYSNLNSFKNFRTELVNEYFDYSKMRKRIDEMIKEIEKQYNLGEREKSVECFEALSKAIQTEIDLYVENGIEIETISENFNARKLNKELKQRLKKIDKKYLKHDEKKSERDEVQEVISNIRKRSNINER